MSSHTKLGIWTLIIIVSLVVLAKFSGVSASKTYSFDFTKGITLEYTDNVLREIVERNLKGVEGDFAIFIENMSGDERYPLAVNEQYPSASLYKLVLMAAVLKEEEQGSLKMEDTVSATKAHLTDVLGSVDFGYEDVSGGIEYTIEEALTRVGRISDNFAAIMLTEKLRRGSTFDPLAKMALELGMENTNLNPKGDELITTTASDIATFFKKLYKGQVVSKTVSDKIIGFLALSKINDRIPAQLPKEVKIVHKTGELSRIRHDAGIVYLDKEVEGASESAVPKKAYLLVMLSKNLKYENDGVEAFANISKEVWEYFSKKI
ncbi:hypothetical protein A3A14_02280 [Candidatus Daviesbacteria bacterium RIFCSPLOWO2_01_FULL_43_38]|uniref:Beta-lactamase class A catalytic domain-containing protein n=2 Tax=Candidatus Daviesiibacteriota TaxID=1752718 RepID=A0A1F5K5Q8_9BACT|nr:MAG: Beta-lactamase [Candidatus Daviesbacteria bacterium GW2011_GWA1_42_6]OGE19209.1 MAG: hypothetical protein A2874_02470 [Candidatus Daviesbacteria bacterium RIFCSPHIGHO2_01_FULL_43_17]OGE36272.1 MAG: hypothetical protein A3E45_04240 [Candidatus Daviesbacteria bacterium RIFCSPHIGHO2_12_FULL_43_11]OGE63324.1 MAG: hypothetical protein A3A14_02280 [Candidatus Daviesbacteria bacterium RIFCSPLOWO2_01_FULL_43_38]OGE70474.1 MAG: hypothetical protein A3J21_01135 [Candidatus Daviesbacteria bacteriu